MQDGLKQLFPPDFPPLLREIPDAPERLHVRGTMPPFDHAWLAVVGSRACTPYGRQAVRHLIAGLRGYPVVIVSGLAFGIDAEAHRAALDTGLPTVGVPGSGLDWDVVYPRSNLALAREIVERGGALISEEEPGARSAMHMYPKRNRIMAGMCRATLMIEAKERSGSLITARLTAEYDRDLLVVPGSIFSDESRGTHQFLRLGATPITSPADLAQALDLGDAEVQTATPEATDAERAVLDALSGGRSRDELLALLDMPVSEANILLSTMEIRGLIVEESGTIRRR